MFDVLLLTLIFVIYLSYHASCRKTSNYFAIPRPHFSDYISYRSEMINETNDFSGHTVFIHRDSTTKGGTKGLN